MTYFLSLFFLFYSISIPSSEVLPGKIFSIILLKANKYNRIKTDSFIIVHSQQKMDRASEISEYLDAKKYEIYSLPEKIEGYQNVVCIGLSNEQIKKMRTHFGKILTITDDSENIKNVSLCLALKDNGKPLILVNLSQAKEEADFTAQFLKIASMVN